MLLWFAGLAPLLVWVVFRDPRFDYRLVVVGALLPDLVDGVTTGGAGVLHSLPGSGALLVLVMLATRRGGYARRHLLAIPIGTLVHLLLDGAWTQAKVFWWPFTGWSFDDASLPVADRPVPVVVVQELIGGAVLLWFWYYRRPAATR